MSTIFEILPNVPAETPLHNLTDAQLDALNTWYCDLHGLAEGHIIRSVIDGGHGWAATIDQFVERETALAGSKSRFSISTRTATQRDPETNWDDHSSLESALQEVTAIKSAPEDYREIVVQEWIDDEAPRMAITFRRHEFRSGWTEVRK